jgi:hypothetical protein
LSRLILFQNSNRKSRKPDSKSNTDL